MSSTAEADLCKPLSNGLPCFTSEAAGSGMSTRKQGEENEQEKCGFMQKAELQCEGNLAQQPDRSDCNSEILLAHLADIQ